jgi:hypothetical protein
MGGVTACVIHPIRCSRGRSRFDLCGVWFLRCDRCRTVRDVVMRNISCTAVELITRLKSAWPAKQSSPLSDSNRRPPLYKSGALAN